MLYVYKLTMIFKNKYILFKNLFLLQMLCKSSKESRNSNSYLLFSRYIFSTNFAFIIYIFKIIVSTTFDLMS